MSHWSERAGIDVGVARMLSGPTAGGANTCIPTQGGIQMPPRGVTGADAGAVRLIYPPWVNKMPQARDFRINAFDLLLPAGNGSTVESPEFMLPGGNVGWLQQFYQFVLTPTAQFSAVYQLQVNGQPVSGFDNVQLPPGIANFVYLGDDEIQYRIPDHGKVKVVITNRSALAWTVGVTVQGWYNPIADEQRAFGDALHT